jgi:glycosyltransferase domain-containing protein
MSLQKVTIIVLVHNNQLYLQRALAYYAAFESITVIIADSSAEPFAQQSTMPKGFVYFHTADQNLTNKIHEALQKTITAYVALVGADDFIVVPNVLSCANFLKTHPDYAAAIGQDIFFRPIGKRLLYQPVYEAAIPPVETADGLQRLQDYFSMYRTLYSAVHYTQTLTHVFSAAVNKVPYLYLNEFLVCIYPVFLGKIKHFDTVYTLRQYDTGSLGFTTVKLYEVVQKDGAAYDRFIDLNATAIANKADGGHFETVRLFLHQLIHDFAQQLSVWDKPVKKSFTKKVGAAIAYLPLVGKAIVSFRRRWHLQKQTNAILQNPTDRQHIMDIQKAILQH